MLIKDWIWYLIFCVVFIPVSLLIVSSFRGEAILPSSSQIDFEFEKETMEEDPQIKIARCRSIWLDSPNFPYEKEELDEIVNDINFLRQQAPDVDTEEVFNQLWGDLRNKGYQRCLSG